MGAKLEPKVVKTAIKNASKFEVDFKMHCDRFAQTAAAGKAFLRIRGEIQQLQ